MKVLFAVNNEDISEAIVKKYQKKYKEIISYKNVYYFNAILKEIQKDKTYDRIIVSEDLEQFTNTSYEQMDKFIFERLDSISDEAENNTGEDVPIILICTERRNKSEEILVKLFGIGIYNAIIGNDRSIDEVCRLIYRPRTKREAKTYYQIDANQVNYKAENEDDVSEVEIQNILAHFKRLGKNENRYIESYNNIATQYNDNQLKVISKFLPLSVRAVLEEKSPKYQQVMAYNKAVSEGIRKQRNEANSGLSEKLLTNSNQNKALEKPIVIPSSIKSADNVKKLTNKTRKIIEEEPEEIEQPDIEDIEVELDDLMVPQKEEKIEPIEDLEPIEEIEPVKPKRGRGRPRKKALPEEGKEAQPKPKRGRGRPRKNALPEDIEEESVSNLIPVKEENTILPEVESMDEDDDDEETMLPGISFNSYEEDDDDEFVLPSKSREEDEEEEDDEFIFSNNARDEQTIISSQAESTRPTIKQPSMLETKQNYVENNHIDLSNVLQGNKKIVAVVGTSKNGTSFIVNNLAELLSSTGVNVAILDTTKNRNSYYIYTKNEEELRKTAMSSISNLTSGVANGIRVNSNLAVYTSLPNENTGIENVQEVLSTLARSHSIVFIDCDFDTPKGYFSAAQEVYLVQTMDVLTIQPLTAFLKELVVQGILDEQKIRIIINKYVRVRGISEREIIGGMAYYNDPAMTYQTELFDKTTVKYITIPFEEETYIRYLEGLINCEVSLKGYSKNFMQNLRQLGNMTYPLAASNARYAPPALGNTGNNAFSSSMNNTLNQMKRNY